MLDHEAEIFEVGRDVIDVLGSAVVHVGPEQAALRGRDEHAGVSCLLVERVERPIVESAPDRGRRRVDRNADHAGVAHRPDRGRGRVDVGRFHRGERDEPVSVRCDERIELLSLGASSSPAASTCRGPWGRVRGSRSVPGTPTTPTAMPASSISSNINPADRSTNEGHGSRNIRSRVVERRFAGPALRADGSEPEVDDIVHGPQRYVSSRCSAEACSAVRCGGARWGALVRTGATRRYRGTPAGDAIASPTRDEDNDGVARDGERRGLWAALPPHPSTGTPQSSSATPRRPRSSSLATRSASSSRSSTSPTSR